MSDLTVSKEILSQLGGNKFIMMVGAKNLVGSDNSLQMKIMTNKIKATHLTITLDWTDTYTFEFVSVRAGKVTVKNTTSGIYFDMMKKHFTEVTGLDVSL